MDTIQTRKPQIPNHVRDLRERAGMSLQDLATKTGISVQMLSKIERGERALTDYSLTAIAAAFKVKKSFVLNEVDTPSSPPAKGDFVEDDLEAMLLKCWRGLSLDAKFTIFREISSWATARIESKTERLTVVNE